MNLNTMLIGNHLVDMDQVKRMSVDTRGGNVVYTITDYDNRTEEIRVPRDFRGSANEKAAKNMNNTYKEVMDRVVSGDVFADEVKEIPHAYTEKAAKNNTYEEVPHAYTAKELFDVMLAKHN